MRILTLVAAVSLLVLPLTAQQLQTRQTPQLGTPQVEATGATRSNVVYGTGGKEKLKLDVFLPRPKPDSPVPAVIVIHGGAWIEGDKDYMAPMARWLAKNGYVAFSINYRLLDGKKNQWPAQLEDAQTAVRWVRAHAAEYGVDPARIGAFGHSAGAQMAAMLGVTSTGSMAAAAPGTAAAGAAGGNSTPEQYSSDVQAVVAQAGPADFTSATYKDADSQQFFTQFLGVGEKQDPARWRAASPALNVTDKTPPFLLVHGTQDNEVPIVQSEELRAALKAHNIPVTFVTVEDGHTLQTSEAKKKLAIETLRFFDETLKAKPGPTM